MAKEPRAGRVKTRLCPPCTPEQAASVARACLADTLDAVAACGAARQVVALDGEVGEWLPSGFEVIAQRGDTFAERLANAWGDTGGPGVQIGMDTPQIGAGELDAMLVLLEGGGSRRAVLAPAADGGWWAIGLPDLGPAEYRQIFDGVAMSTDRTGSHQRRRLMELGFDVVLGDVRRDIDTAGDLAEVAAVAPQSRTAQRARHLGLAPVPAGPTDPAAPP